MVWECRSFLEAWPGKNPGNMEGVKLGGPQLQGHSEGMRMTCWLCLVEREVALGNKKVKEAVFSLLPRCMVLRAVALSP